VSAAVQQCLSRFGRIDALFNVAGISGRKFGDGPIHECTDEGWDFTLETNVKSMFLMCRAVIRQMLAQAPGHNGLRGVVQTISILIALCILDCQSSLRRQRLDIALVFCRKGGIARMLNAENADYLVANL